jgi:hypothetical protein
VHGADCETRVHKDIAKETAAKAKRPQSRSEIPSTARSSEEVPDATPAPVAVSERTSADSLSAPSIEQTQAALNLSVLLSRPQDDSAQNLIRALTVRKHDSVHICGL